MLLPDRRRNGEVAIVRSERQLSDLCSAASLMGRSHPCPQPHTSSGSRTGRHLAARHMPDTHLQVELRWRFSETVALFLFEGSFKLTDGVNSLISG